MSAAPIILRRLVGLACVLLAVSLITFLISNVIPGDPAQMMSGPRASQAQVEQMRETLGLSQPLPVQYGRYLTALSHGDLGRSIVTGRPVAEELLSRLPATIELMLPAILLSALLGVSLGAFAAARKGGFTDRLILTFSTAGISTPIFWFALLLLLLFYVGLGWLPPGGRLDPALSPPPDLTGFYVIDAAIAGQGAVFRSVLAHLALPVVALAFIPVAVYIRVVRAAMLETIGEDFVRTAKANGLSARRVLFRYVLPNSLSPFVTLFGIELGHLLFGSVIVETIFAWPGLGNYALNAILELDFPVIMGFTLLTSLAYVAANLLVDLVLLWLDPRLKGVG